MKKLIFLLAASLIVTGGYSFAQVPADKQLASDKTMSVYFIGNSLTASITLDRLHGFFGQRGIDLQFGSQLSGGKSLLRQFKYTAEPDQKWIAWETDVPSGKTFLPNTNHYMVPPANWRFGRYDKALSEHKWDALVMATFNAPLKDDLEGYLGVINFALQNKATENFYIQQHWLKRPRVKAEDDTRSEEEKKANPNGIGIDIDFTALWTVGYEAGPEDTGMPAMKNNGNREFYAKLLTILNEKLALPKPVRLIPIGEVFCALDEKIKKGELPGLEDLAKRQPDMLPGLRPGTDFSKGVNIFYADPIHYNPMPHSSATLGNFVSGTTIFAVLSGQSPVGLSAASYSLEDTKDAALIRALQQTIWDVVTSNPNSGVKK